MKRWISVLLFLLVLLFAVPSLAAEQDSLWGAASETIQQLMEAWDIDQPGGKYPDDVAGLYVMGGDKAAVVLVYGVTEARKNEIRALVTKPEVIVFKSAKYSCNELTAIADTIDSDGSFELVGWWVGDYETENAVMVEVYYGGKAAAKAYFKKHGDKVKVVEGERNTLLLEAPDAASRNEAWLKNIFPKLRSLETTETRFVFASAPKVTKTRAVLNKKGESLTLYRFETEKDVQKCAAMIKGNTLVYGGKTVYVDTLFPATYYIHPEGRAIALYCGSDAAVNKKLLETYSIAGEYGGYFDNRNFFDPPGVDPLVVNPPRETAPLPPESIKELLARTEGIYLVKVKSAPTWNGRNYDTENYSLEVTRNIRGSSREGLSLEAYPDVMRAGRSYVLFVRTAAIRGKAASIYMADWTYQSAFEINDRGDVLPIREYGMKAPVKLEKFLKGLR